MIVNYNDHIKQPSNEMRQLEYLRKYKDCPFNRDLKKQIISTMIKEETKND